MGKQVVKAERSRNEEQEQEEQEDEDGDGEGKGKGLRGLREVAPDSGYLDLNTHTRSISHSLIHSHPPTSILIFIHPLFLSLLSFLFFLTFSFHYIAHLAIYQAKPSNLLLLIYRGLCMHANAYIVRVLRVREADR